MIPEADDPPPDEADPFESLETDDPSEMLVLAVVALFIGGAVAFRWIFR
jgi:hypothetical protein